MSDPQPQTHPIGARALRLIGGLGFGLLVTLAGVRVEAAVPLVAPTVVPIGPLAPQSSTTRGGSIVPGDYRIRVGDELAVTIYGEKDLSNQVSVLPGGTIVLPLVGQIPVGGQTPDQASKTVATSLRRYLRDPVVTIAVAKEAPLVVLVLGDVVKPDKYSLDPQSHLIDAIAAAGGLGPTNGDYPDARVATAGGKVTNYSLQKLFRDGDMALNVPLTDNMTVYIPSPETFNIVVEGAVQHPGDVQLHAGDRLSIALARAGFDQATNPDLNRVQIRRIGPDGKPQQTVVNMYKIYNSGDLSKDIVMEKGDLVIVPAAAAHRDSLSGPASLIYSLGHLFFGL